MTFVRSILLGICLIILPASAFALGDTVAEDRASQFTVGTVSADEAFASREAAVYLILGLLSIATAMIVTSLSLKTRTQTETALDRVEQQLPAEEVQ